MTGVAHQDPQIGSIEQQSEAFQPRIFFNHIPKCAGTTLNPLLTQAYSMREITDAEAIPREAVRLGIHRTKVDAGKIFGQYRFLYSHSNFTAVLGPEWDVITVLRDPLSRLHSLFRHWQTFSDEAIDNAKSPDDHKAFKRSARNHTLESFIKIDRREVLRLFRNGMANQLVPDFPKPVRLRITREELLEYGLRSLDEYACVGLMERLDDFVRILCHKYHWPPPKRLTNLNVRGGGAVGGATDPSDAVKACIDLDQIVYRRASEINDSRVASMCEDLIDESHRAVDTPELAGLVDQALQDRAREFLIQAQHNQPQEFVLPMEHAIRGTGWLEREGLDLPRVYRWTGEGLESTADFIIKPVSRYTVELDVISVIDPDILAQAKIDLNGEPMSNCSIRRRSILHPRIRCFTAHVENSPVAEDGFCRLTITVPKTISHAQVDPNCPDTRQKGLAIREIRIRAGD